MALYAFRSWFKSVDDTFETSVLQKRTKGKILDAHIIRLILKIISVKLFLDVIFSSSADISKRFMERENTFRAAQVVLERKIHVTGSPI